MDNQNLGAITLRAAVGQQDIALEAWHSLLDGIGFDDLPNSVVRFLPRIYLNLRSFPSVPEFNRIRGAYKLNWVKNVRLSVDAVKIFQNLTKRHCSYLVIKGFAVGVLTKKLGARVLGDVDVVVRRGDIAQATDLLKGHGYRFRDENSPLGVRGLGAYENDRGSIIDLHAFEFLPPWSPLSLARTSEVSLNQTQITIPTVSDLITHSVGHGLAQNAESDLTQSALDYVDLHRLTIKTGKIRSYLNISDFVELIQNSAVLPGDTALEILSGEGREETLKERLTRIWNTCSRLLLAPVMVLRRRLELRQMLGLVGKCLSHPSLIPYALWMIFGQFKAIERALAKLGIGLAHPRKLFLHGGPCPSRDYRVVVINSSGAVGRMSIHLAAIPEGGPWKNLRERSVSINGVGYGFFPVQNSLEAKYLSPQADENFEISLTSNHRKPVIQFLDVTAIAKPMNFGSDVIAQVG